MSEEVKATKAESKGGFGSEARNKATESYSAHTATLEGIGGDKPTPSLPDSLKEDATTETSPEAEVTAPSPGVEGDRGLEPEQEPLGEKKEKGNEAEDDRTVSIAALHEERERRKESQAEIATLKEQQAVLLKDLNERDEIEKMSGQTGDERDAELVRLKRQVEELTNKDSERDEVSQAEAANESRRKLKENIASTDKSLADEGFPGFAFAQAVVAGEINALVEQDPDNKFMLNDPASWKRVYKEKVYPGMKSAFTSKERAEKNAEKEALKDEAALAGNAGKADVPAPKAKEKEHTYADYVKNRKSGSAY